MIAFAKKLALDLDSSVCGVEQAQLHSDQRASPAVAHDLDREPTAGLPDDAVTGTLRALCTPLVVICTWTGALSRPRACLGLSSVM